MEGKSVLEERLRRAEDLSVQLVCAMEEERVRSSRFTDKESELMRQVAHLQAELEAERHERQRELRERASLAQDVLRTLPPGACWFESGRIPLQRRRAAASAARSPNFSLQARFTARAPVTKRHAVCWLISPATGTVMRLSASAISMREDGLAVQLSTVHNAWTDASAAVEWVAWAHPSGSDDAVSVVELVYVAPPGLHKSLIDRVESFLQVHNINEGDARGQTLLHAAACSGNVELVQWLVARGATVDVMDFQRRTPLLCALGSAKFAAARLLTLQGADFLARCDAGGTSLHHLFKCQRFAPEFAEMLSAALSAGVNIDAENAAKETALHLAAERSLGPEQVKLLLQNGANPNHVAANKDTPLLYAVSRNPHPEILSALLAAGADVNIVGSAGKKAVAVAKGNSDRRAVDILTHLDHGAGGSGGIPEKVVAKVLVKLDPEDLIRMRLVCKIFQKVADEIMAHALYWTMRGISREEFFNRGQHDWGYAAMKTKYERNMDEWVTRPFSQKIEEVSYDLLLKFVCLGDSCTGKTSFIQRLVANTFTDEHHETLSIEFKTILRTSQGKLLKIQLWDQASPRYKHWAANAYYRGSHGFFLFYDTTQRETWLDIPIWIEEVKKFSETEKGLVLVIVGTRCDIEEERQVTLAEAIEFSNTRNIPVFEISSRESINLETAVKALAEHTLAKLDKPAGQNQPTSSKPPPPPFVTASPRSSSIARSPLSTALSPRSSPLGMPYGTLRLGTPQSSPQPLTGHTAPAAYRPDCAAIM